MGQTLSVDLVLNAMGFKQGITEAQKATADYTNATKISDTQIKQLNRAMKQAQQETRALAIAFNSLSKAEQESAQGQALQRQMQESMQEAARLKDTVDDTTAAIKAMASDTAGLDALKEGLDIGKSAAIAYAGAIAKLTGDEQSLKDVTATLAMIEGGFNAAIKISNALQKQSAIMTGIMNVQRKAAAVAINLEKNSTVGATAAQKVFNAVAKANPYVLLATLAATAAVAIGGYMLATRKASDEDKNAIAVKKALAEAQNKYNDTYQQTATSLISKYKTLQAEWRSLTTEHQKNQWIKNNKDAFKDLGLKINNVASAENAFNTNTNNIVSGLMKRAKAAAIAAQAQELYSQALAKATEVENLKAEYADKMANAKPIAPQNIYSPTTGTIVGQTKGVTVEERRAQLMDELTEKMLDLKLQQNEITQKANEFIRKSVEMLGVEDKLTNDKEKQNKATKEQLTHLAQLEEAEKKLRTELENIDPKAPNAAELRDNLEKQINEAAQAVKDYKIFIHYEVEEPKVSYYDQLKKQLKDTQAKLYFAPDEASVDKIWAEIHDLEDKIEAEEVRLKIKTEPVVDTDKISNEISDIMSSVQAPDQKIDISSLTGDKAEQAEKDLAALERYKTALQSLTDMMNEAGASDFQISAAQDGIEQLIPLYDQLIEKAQQWAAENQKAADMEKNIKKTQQAMQTLGQIGQSVGSIFSSLGQITGDEGFAVAGIITEAIAQVALGYATATAQASEMGPWAWIAFAISGLATMISTIAAIKQQTSGYATGGVIPGNSVSGDNLLIAANSREMVLTQAQQARLFNIANGQDIANNITPAVQTANVAITSTRIQGSDIVLAIKNQGKLDHKKYLND